MIGEQLHLACLHQQGDFLVGEPAAGGEEVGTALERPAEGLHPTPTCDAAMVTRPEHLGHAPSPEDSGAGVLGVLEEPRQETLLFGRCLVAEHPREEPRHRLHDSERRELAPCKHDVAERQLVVDEVVSHPLVHPLVAAAK